ncbi:hypothetical protein IPF37_00715 [bacterium]|nr:MAG: hypothetical protein IPF37_00715 [bacterium]
MNSNKRISCVTIFIALGCLVFMPCCRKKHLFEYNKENKLSRRKPTPTPPPPPPSTQGVAAALKQTTPPPLQLDLKKTPTLTETNLVDKTTTSSIPTLDTVLTTTHQNKELKTPQKETASELGASSLNFEVENKTGKPVYISGFIYMRKNTFTRWRWFKTDIYKLDPKESKIVHVDTVPDEKDRNNVYGMLGIFNTQLEADEATYELTDERHILDLDLLTELKGKKVTITIEQYGFKEPFYDYDFVKKNEAHKNAPELDFSVLNNTGKPLYLCCFTYEKKAKGRWIAAIEDKDDMSVWHFEKTKIQLVKPGEKVLIDIDTILSERDRNSVRGYLGVFEENEEQKALESTFELLEPKNKLNLGNLIKVKQKTIVLDIKRYGVGDDFIEYVVKPVRHIDMTKITK